MPKNWQPAWSLALDVAVNANEFVVKASVPGFNPDNLEITYNANTLTIKGETKAEEANPKRITIQSGKSSQVLEGKVTEIKHKN